MQETRVPFLGLEDAPRGGNGNPLQYSCLGKKSHGQRSLAGCSPWGSKGVSFLIHCLPFQTFSSAVEAPFFHRQSSMDFPGSTLLVPKPHPVPFFQRRLEPGWGAQLWARCNWSHVFSPWKLCPDTPEVGIQFTHQVC